MANRFKDYRAQLKSNKTVVLSDDELNLYSKTANNEGVSHEHTNWIITTKETLEDESICNDKERTVVRNMEREQKNKNMANND
jgi:hypothetical protein